MSFYSDFAEHYERIFPFRPGVYEFLRGLLEGDGGGASADGGSLAGRRVLDLGCGPGHYCGAFAKAGARAVGIDLDGAMIDEARRRYPGAEFSALDMRRVGKMDGPFDLIWCIGNVAPHVTREDFVECLRNVAALLRPDGVWIVQTVNWDFVLERDEHVFAPRQLGEGLPTFHREYRSITPEGLRFVTRLEDGGREIFADEVTLYPLPADEIRALHTAAGFVEVSHAADFAGKPFAAGEFGGSVFAFRKAG